MPHDPDALRAKARHLPLSPGVYLMRDGAGKIIYVGKAKALKNRVSQYFGAGNRHPEKVRRMVEQVADFDYILTDSEFEALVLECSLIKQYAPKYNILLKDDKGYHYIRVSQPPWPRIAAVMQKADDGAQYLGPYVSSFTVRQSVDEVNRVFRLPTCNRQFPREFGRGRPCLSFFIEQCAAPCRGRMSEEDYNEAVAQAVDFLKGGSSLSVKILTEQMDDAAEHLDFEKAARLRDRIKAIRRMSERQKVINSSVPVQDVMALAQMGGTAAVEVFRFEDGRLYDREDFLLGQISDAPSARKEFIERYYAMREPIPPVITLDGETEDMALLSEFLSQKAGRRVRLNIPQKGSQYKLVEMCRANAAEKLAQSGGRSGKETAALDELGRLLGLPAPPETIEAYDISHTAGSESVAGMVVFHEGHPLKSAYRRFAVKDAPAHDDYAAMREVVERRLARYEEEKASGEGFGRLPDLILLDGGRGHVAAVEPILRARGFSIPLFGMVKDDRHRTRAIARDGGEVAITGSRSAFTLVSAIQEEVHRFAITYHRQKRQKKVVASTLLQIPGIGPARARALLKAFGSIARIRAASLEELAAVRGMNKAAAEAVRAHYGAGEAEA